MKPPTTGERIACADIVPLDDEAMHDVRTNRYWPKRRELAAAIDAAIAAERERIAAFCEANPNKYGDQLAAAIRARGNA